MRCVIDKKWLEEAVGEAENRKAPKTSEEVSYFEDENPYKDVWENAK